jgi:Rps23 Pro-64 3,4-dihydroxylase Tpa1-like proline 4-hydroxylase
MTTILSKIYKSNAEYNIITPFPYMYQDNFLDENYAKQLQSEILNINMEEWDRYNNPFEQKYTLRNKFNFPPLLKDLFDRLTDENFIKELSNIVGYELKLDTTRNFWGVHTYGPNDMLDIHIDAGLHPTLGLKKQITLGIYLSSNWKEDYGCKLEIWKGDNCTSEKPKLHYMVDSIAPLFNRLVIFTCNDYAWHGNPEPVRCNDNSKRIFITISYLSKNFNDLNKKIKAQFIARPNDPSDNEKDKLRLLRADPEKYKEIYRI